MVERAGDHGPGGAFPGPSLKGRPPESLIYGAALPRLGPLRVWMRGTSIQGGGRCPDFGQDCLDFGWGLVHTRAQPAESEQSCCLASWHGGCSSSVYSSA